MVKNTDSIIPLMRWIYLICVYFYKAGITLSVQGRGRSLRVELPINLGSIPSKCKEFFFSPPKISAPYDMVTRKNLSIGKVAGT